MLSSACCACNTPFCASKIAAAKNRNLYILVGRIKQHESSIRHLFQIETQRLISYFEFYRGDSPFLGWGNFPILDNEKHWYKSGIRKYLMNVNSLIYVHCALLG